MSNPSPAPSSPRVSSGTRRLFPLAALVIAGASLAVGCSSDDTTPEAKASSTEVTAESGGTEASVGDLKISNARIGEPAGPNTGMFLSITNDGDTADRLVAVTTGISPEVQLHETVTDGDRTSMQELPSGIDVPAGTTTVLEPGGLHAMFMKVEPLTADEQDPVTLFPSPTAPTTAAWTTAESALPEPPSAVRHTWTCDAFPCPGDWDGLLCPPSVAP